MKFVRGYVDQKLSYGILSDTEDKVRLISKPPTDDYQLTNQVYSLSEVELVPPCQPNKIVCVGLNYLDHARELEMDLPAEPIIFLKPTTALVGSGAQIKYPQMSNQVDYEAELAIIIGREAKNITSQQAEDYILGYSCFNDLTARDLQSRDGQWSRAKSFDTFAPVGPVIATELNPNDLQIQLYQNGSLQQDSTTSQMIFSPSEVVSFISKIMTLQPGDIIATGTPPGIGSVSRGDQLEVQIEGIGSLINHVE
ncbi:MAG: fumarylacetoacetate hydrolase family protein [Bacillota bacterium]